MEVVKSQGLTINERHVLLIADVMTYYGEIKGMTRYGIVGNKQNVLTRASFETPLKHLAYGALQNEENYLNTITENVMTNQIVRVGTGIPRISVSDKDKRKK
jgi:DNA-directed RNA polymerase subunit A"